MKRIGNLYNEICNVENLKLADKKARKGKSHQKGIKQFDLNKEDNIVNLYYLLKNKEYKVSGYKVFTIFDPKERQIFMLSYIDRIVQHAIMNIVEETFTKCFISNTYSCIKTRGLHKGLKDLTKALKDNEGTKYCLKLDIKKYYPSVDLTILKYLLRKKFKDQDLLWLLDEIIDSNLGGGTCNWQLHITSIW